jgi:tripartite-type tricarboxylate transporter receptor subunit TctC
MKHFGYAADLIAHSRGGNFIVPAMAARGRKGIAWIAMALAGFVIAHGAHAAYPEHAVRMVVPFAPGGSTDVLARVVGQRLSESLGQPVIVDNRPAGGGIVGSDLVAKAPADGYTLLIGSIATMAVAPGLYEKLPYAPLKDFANTGLWVTFPLVLVVNAGSPVAGLKELIALAKAKPGTLSFGAQGIGSSSHIFAALMNHLAGIKVVIVPYKGGAPAMNGLLAGEVDYSMVAVSTALAQVEAGKLRALGVTSARPSSSLPNVPAIASVLPGYEGLNFHGMHAPAKTPPAIMARLQDETTRILRQPEIVKLLNAMAMDIVAGTPEQYRAFIKAQIELWGPVIKSSGLRAE